jgi:hypothetical protein
MENAVILGIEKRKSPTTHNIVPKATAERVNLIEGPLLLLK